MKLTKLQRHTAYLIIQHEVEEQAKTYHGLYCGFCFWLSETFNFIGRHDIYDGKFFKQIFPELYNKADRFYSSNSIRFDSWGNRLKALNQAIQETY